MTHLALLSYSLYFLLCSKLGLGVSWIDFAVLTLLVGLFFLIDVGKAKFIMDSARALDRRLSGKDDSMDPEEGRKPTTQEDPFFSKIK